MLNQKQLEQIRNLGIDEEMINSQVKIFKDGFNYANLSKPATLGDGIIKASDKDIEKWTKIYDEFAVNSRIEKFVPASGAATRMFKTFYKYIENDGSKDEVENILKNIKKFAFYDLLNTSFTKDGKNIQNADNKEILNKIINKNGLNYGNFPKGLICFHKYGNDARTALEEHVVEGLLYAISKGSLKLHFSISPEYENIFKNEFKTLIDKYEKLQKAKIEINYSFQKKSTDTIAVDMNNNPVIDENGLLVFRPGGHGALLENLNEIDADVIFIKNIDNVVPDYLKPLTVRYKKTLAGLLLHIKQQITDTLAYLEWHDSYTEKKRHEIGSFMETYLGIKVPDGIDNTIYAGYIKSKIDKPIRICGIVKNAGEPGGGPFWVINRKGELSLQIIESSQVDPSNKKQQEILKSATHFNPVDLVCYTKDYTGHKFNLLKYRDPYSGFITEKTYNGQKIKAQELPGLWNGGMSHWITLFVEVPLETFNPVKTIDDLLRKEHQPKD